MIDWTKQYGHVYTIYLGSTPTIIVTDYDRIVQMFVKNGDAYAGRVRSYFIENIRSKILFIK
jgi:hypothetical protein